MSVRIRDLKLPGDKAAVLSFIDGSQRYEHAFERLIAGSIPLSRQSISRC